MGLTECLGVGELVAVCILRDTHPSYQPWRHMALQVPARMPTGCGCTNPHSQGRSLQKSCDLSYIRGCWGPGKIQLLSHEARSSPGSPRPSLLGDPTRPCLLCPSIPAPTWELCQTRASLLIPWEEARPYSFSGLCRST